MADITVKIINPSETEKTTVVLPNDVAVRSVTEAVVDAMGLPSSGNNGRQLHYILNERNEFGDLEPLSEEETLEENGVGDGAYLQLTVETVAEPSPVENLFGHMLDAIRIEISTLGQRFDQQTELLAQIVHKLDTLNTLHDEAEALLDTALDKLTPPEITYIDFDLAFSRDSSSYKHYQVQASWSDGHNRLEGENRFELPINLRDLQYDYLAHMGFGQRGSLDPYELAKDLGQVLFEAVFGNTVRDCFTHCQTFADPIEHGIRIRLRLQDTPELINYPWEFFWNQEDDFLARSVYTPIIRYLPSRRQSRLLSLKPDTPLQMLVITANPPGSRRLNIEREQIKLQRALGELEEQKLLHINWLHNATPQTLQHMLAHNQGPHILHYIGHADIDDDQGYLILEGETGTKEYMKATQFSALIRDCRRLQLVVLNACRGAQTNNQNPFAGIALEVMRAHVPVTVAMQQEISDPTAIKFSNVFYSCLAKGWSVYAAMGQTRKAIYAEYGSDIEWMIPVLYSRSPDGIIFERFGPDKK